MNVVHNIHRTVTGGLIVVITFRSFYVDKSRYRKISIGLRTRETEVTS